MWDVLVLQKVINLIDIKNIRKSGSDTLKGSRDGKQIFGSFNYLSTFTERKLSIIPNLKIDFSRTTLSDYVESGTSPLSYNKQTVETANVYTGLNFHNIYKRDNFIVKPFVGFEMGIDISPSSNVSLNYVSDPGTTYISNLIGTSNILQICKDKKNIKSILIITSDKCYKIKNSLYPFKENDELSGDDPYSASKACQEIISWSYAKSFFHKKKNYNIATCRAGNIIGGGDFSKNRLLPDIMLTLFKKKMGGTILFRHHKTEI